MKGIKNKSILLAVLAALFVLGIETVLAAYTGPVGRSSSVTYWERKNCHYLAIYNPPGPEYYSCTLDLYFAPSQSCPADAMYYFNPVSCAGWPGKTCGLDISCDITETVTIEDCNPGDEACTMREEGIDLDPATVSGAAGCTLPGNNGWCRGGATVDLSASEPVGGERITWLEGNQGAGDFALCDPADASSVSCTWLVDDGERSLSFWAHSTFGDTSEMGSVALKVDGTDPTANFSLSGTPNAAGWYNTSLTLTTTGTDAISGVAGEYVQVNSGAWQSSPVVLAADGIYTARGVVLDNAGNQTATANEAIKLDGTAPTFTVMPDRAPDYSDWYFGPVTVSVNATDNLSGYAYSSYLLSDESGVPHTGTMPVTISVEGVNVLDVSVYDVAGNHDGGSSVYRIDSSAPTAGTNISGTVGLNQWYVSPVELRVTGTDAGSGICGATLNLDNAGWQPAPLTDYAGQGTHAFVGQTQDCVGQSSPITPSESFKVDTVFPTLEALYPAPDGDNNWHITPFTVDITGTDLTSGLAFAQGRTVGGAWQNDSLLVDREGTVNLEFRSQDNAGNTTNSGVVPFLVDLTDPTLVLDNAGTAGLSGWYVSAVTVTANASDLISGVQSVQMRRPGEPWQTTTTLVLSADGSHTVEAQAGDNAGRSAEAQETVKLDATAPTLTATYPVADGLNGWYVNPIEIGISGTDATSGVLLAQVRANSGAWQDGGLTLGEEGVNSLDFRVQDNAGNLTTANSQVSMDLANPTLTITTAGTMGTNGWYTSAATLTAAGADAISGLMNIQIREGAAGWQVRDEVTVTADGTHPLEFMATDNAGRETLLQREVKVDQTAPTLAPTAAGTLGLNGWYTSAVTLKANAADATSGIASVLPAAEVTVSEDTTAHTTNWTARDNAGNEASAALVIKVDRTPPVVAFDPVGGVVVGTVTLTGQAADATSGLMTVEVSTNLGLSWTEVTVNPDGSWSMPWDTLLLPGGQMLVQARATDQAGNVNTVNLTATVANRRPSIELTERWMYWESGEMRINVGDVDYENVTVRICDYESRWPCVVYSYDAGEAPEYVTWNRKFGEVIAPVGEYAVDATVTDLLGRSDTDTGVIVVPARPAAATPTVTLTPTATPTVTGTPQPKPTQEPTQMATPTATVVIPVVPPPAPVEEIPLPQMLNYGPYLVLIGFCFALGASVSRDRRPREWQRLAEQLSKINQLNK